MVCSSLEQLFNFILVFWGNKFIDFGSIKKNPVLSTNAVNKSTAEYLPRARG